MTQDGVKSGEVFRRCAVIAGVGSSVPQRKISNEELAKMVDTSDEWISSHTGIKNRHVVAPGEFTSDLASGAALQALLHAGVKPEEIDMIICATSTPDHNGFPSTACIVQGRLGAVNAAAFDLAAACSGFIYALELARGMVESGSRKKVLVIGADILSRIIDWTDRNSCVLFGDGAGAAVVSGEPREKGKPRGIIHSVLAADGKSQDALVLRGGGSRESYCSGAPPAGGEGKEDCVDPAAFFPPRMEMNGKRVYDFAVRVVTETILRLLEETGLGMDDIRAIVPHQANARIISAAAKRLGVSEDKFYMNIAEYANTSAASIPIALTEMSTRGLLSPGDLILTVGFGAGLTYGGNVIRW